MFPCVMECLLEGIVMEASIVAMVVQDLNSVFCHVLFKGKLGNEHFSLSIVELEVDKSEAAKVVDQDGSTLVALLGEFAF